jgi:HEAT repeat protein
MGLLKAPDVARLRARGNVEGLVRAANYKRDPEVQRQAREALGEMIDFLIRELQTRNLRKLMVCRDALVACGEPAIDAMIFVHTDRQSLHRRQDVTFVLGQARATKAVPVLIVALRDTDPMLRKLAADALGKIGDARAARPLHVATKDDNVQVRKSAAKAYEQVESKAESAPDEVKG